LTRQSTIPDRIGAGLPTTQTPTALDRAECDRLLAAGSVGHLAFTDSALPQIFPVNYAMDDRTIVFRTTATGRLAACCRDAVVAFEIDRVDSDVRTGWSVLVVGDATAITDDSEIIRARQLPFAPWAGGERDHYVRITPGIVSGRSLG
jgi:nitroimidazol reductase NimA-like FMN-containing flavoprotein (pyridoxamine 5'-phosphate oxidase superfamily)